MVDMSPEAVTQRLRLMDELWELSIALMNAKDVKSAEPTLDNCQQGLRPGDGDTSQNRER